MINRDFLLYIFFASSALIYSTNCNMSAKRIKQNGPEIEGFIILEVKTFANVDSKGFAQKTKNGNDSIISHRKMYLQNNCLLDIIGNLNFNNGKHISTDTLSYDFYDLVNQKYILFEKLSEDAKIIKRGSMAIDGSFSNTTQYDPWNGVVDSIWKLTDTVINGKQHGVINFILTGITDSLDGEFIRRTKFWVDYGNKNFPLQLSYILSNKSNGAFVYKMQQPFPDGKTVMITSLEYQPAKLPDTLTKIFERWRQIPQE